MNLIKDIVMPEVDAYFDFVSSLKNDLDSGLPVYDAYKAHVGNPNPKIAECANKLVSSVKNSGNFFDALSSMESDEPMLDVAFKGGICCLRMGLDYPLFLGSLMEFSKKDPEFIFAKQAIEGGREDVIFSCFIFESFQNVNAGMTPYNALWAVDSTGLGELDDIKKRIVVQFLMEKDFYKVLTGYVSADEDKPFKRGFNILAASLKDNGGDVRKAMIDCLAKEGYDLVNSQMNAIIRLLVLKHELKKMR